MNMGDGDAISAISELTSSSLEKLSVAPLAIVDFWAPWCGPCRRLAPVFEEVAKEVTEKYGGRVKFFKVNVDDEGALAQRHGIMTIPTLIAFAGGKPVEKRAGGTKGDLVRWIDKLALGLGIA
ncbi:MAG: thioredoxin family protein [Bacillota bacterium]|jgi:thioredoxin|nr:thioredoxin fold domain-containing protein [Candidatus Fermentithermobacillaceae bacterium]